MLPLIMPVGALLSGAALLLLGSGLLNTLLALRSGIEGYSGAMLGIIMSGYFAGFFLGTILALPLIARVGHIRAFACCAALVASAVLLHVLLINPYAWLIIRVLTGASLVILYTVIESWLNGQTPADKRAKVFALYMTVNLGALALAQQFLRFDPSVSHLLFVGAAILICLSLVPVTCTRMEQPRVQKVARVPLKVLLEAAPVAIGGALFSGLAMGAFWGLAASYAARTGLSVTQVATFVSCAILGGALMQFPLGRCSDSCDRRLVLAVVSVGAALLAIVLIFSSSSAWLMNIVIALYGGLAFAIYPLAVAHLVDHLQVEDMLAGCSGLLLIHGVGAMLGPLLAGQFMALFRTAGLPVYWLLVQTLLAVLAYLVYRRGVAEDPEDHAADFVPMIRTTPSALEMLPQEDVSSVNEDGAIWGANHSKRQE